MDGKRVESDGKRAPAGRRQEDETEGVWEGETEFEGCVRGRFGVEFRVKLVKCKSQLAKGLTRKLKGLSEREEQSVWAGEGDSAQQTHCTH